jgi:hypothetical protein
MSYTTGQQILLPASTAKQRGQKTITLAVNSRDRSLALNPYSNNFRWTLKRPLKDVLSIELLSGCIPAALYNVNNGWNKFTFGENMSRRTITLTPGQYTIQTLIVELQTQLNTGSINTYTITYSSITKKLKIVSSGNASFTFYFATGDYLDTFDNYGACITSINCPARLLGFDQLDYTGNSQNPLNAPHHADPNYCIQRLYLHINVDNTYELNRVETTAGRKDCFHIIYMDPSITDGYYFLNKDTYMPTYYSSPAPIARVAFFTISLRDEFFRLVDLGNYDFTLIFEITTLG